jgi:hypothetical protein
MLRSVETGVVQTDQVDVEVLDQTQGGCSLTYDCDDRADKDSRRRHGGTRAGCKNSQLQ